MQVKRAQMLTLIDDIDKLLATQPSMLLGRWLEGARAIGKNKAEKDYYEKDARMIITVWGGNQRSLNDYANRSWAGLTKDFYKQRWAMFLNGAIIARQQNRDFDEKAFTAKIDEFEDKWINETNKFQTQPVGNSFTICKELATKYSDAILAAVK